MTKRFWLLPAALAVLALACGPSSQPAAPGSPQKTASSDSGQPKPGGTLNVLVRPDPFNWDITIAKTVPNDQGVALAYNSLLKHKSGPDIEFSDIVNEPDLAERWEISPDAKTFTFHLRKGVKFQDLPPVNGRELTSDDVRFTAEYRLRRGEFKDKKLPAAEIGYIYDGLQSVETPDKYTAIFHFEKPYIPFINYAASDWNPILPREIYDQDGNFENTLVGTGPFMLDTSASQKGSRWVFKKNPGYFESGKPYLDEIRWLVIEEESTAYAAFQTGQLDILAPNEGGIDFQDAEQVKQANPEAVVYKYVEPRANQMYLSQLPERDSPVRDVRVRQAIALAIDRDEIDKTMFGGQGAWGMPGAVYGLFTEQEARQMEKVDLERATKLMGEAGYANGVDLEWPVPSSETQANVTMIQLIQAQLKKIGVNVHIKTMDKADQRAIRRKYDFDLDMGFGIGGLHDDPDSVIQARYHSGSKGNYSLVNDPEMDKLLDQSRAEPDAEKRRQLMRAISKLALDNAYTIEILYRPKWTFWKPYVKNYRPHWSVQASYQNAWLDKS